MKTRYLPLVVLSMVPAWLAACAENPAPQTPAEPAPATTAAAPPVTAETAAPPAPAPTPAPVPVADPPPKPAKEKIVGKWQFSFEGDPKTKAEDEAKKKFPKDKDQAKRDAQIAKIAESAAGEWIEFVDGSYVSHVTEKGKDKIVLKIKYDVGSGDNAKLSLKPTGKDEISKKELKDEMAIAFTDDNTITVLDPKKKMTLVFKRK